MSTGSKTSTNTPIVEVKSLSDDSFAGQDDAEVVTVNVTAKNEILSVQLSSEWKQSVDPYNLGTRVVSAANSATAQVLEKSMEGFDPESAVSISVDESPGGASSTPSSDESRITGNDAMRLVEAAMADMNDFMRRVSDITERSANVESSGGHVSATGQRGQVTDVNIDQKWISSARDTEIESELSEILKKVQENSSIGDMVNGPQSQNIAELTELAKDPYALMRRVGLTTDRDSNE